MLRPAFAALLLLWSPPLAFAQEGDRKAPVTQQDPESAYKDLVKAANKAMAEWRAEAIRKAQEAQAAGEAIPALAMTPPTKEFIARAQELAARHAGSDDAVRFLVFICKTASNERNAVRKAVDTLAQAHVESKAIGAALGHLEMAAMRFGAKDAVMKLLDDVLQRNQDADCVAQALIVRGSMRLQSAESDADRALAKADLVRVATTTTNEDLLKQAKDALFEIEHLQVGCKAPEIAAKDVDGVDFKLSDYLGKVVLLDFWGFW